MLGSIANKIAASTAKCGYVLCFNDNRFVKEQPIQFGTLSALPWLAIGSDVLTTLNRDRRSRARLPFCHLLFASLDGGR